MIIQVKRFSNKDQNVQNVHFYHLLMLENYLKKVFTHITYMLTILLDCLYLDTHIIFLIYDIFYWRLLIITFAILQYYFHTFEFEKSIGGILLSNILYLQAM